VDLFKRLRRDIGKIPWGAVASVFAEELQTRTGAAGEVLSQLEEWATHLLGNAVHKWPGVIALGAPCDSPDVTSGKAKKCRSTAVVFCDVCGRKCCLAHARIDYLGDAICEVCIGQAKARVRTAPKTDDVPKAFKVLKLKPTASWDEVRARYKKLVVQHNADRPQSDKSRDANTARLKEFNLAFEVLTRHFEEKRKAA